MKKKPQPVAVRLRALKHAAQYVNWVKEEPDGSNQGPYISGWQKRAANVTGIPWCACFMFCMFDDVGRRVQVRYPASVASWVDWANATGSHVFRPYRGDLVAYSFDGRTNHPNDHIGIVEKVLSLPLRRRPRFLIRTIEGNTGNAVRRKWRWVDPGTVAFIRVRGF